MAHISKRKKAIQAQLKPGTVYPIIDAVAFLQNVQPPLKFDETVEAGIMLGVDPKKSDQGVRGAVLLPAGTGQTVRVAVFAQGDAAKAALAAGADMVGFEDLAEKIKGGNLDFDVVIATPDTMRIVGQLGQVLGPRGLMPNPKVGTVTPDVATAVKNAKAGQVRFRTDKGGIVQARIGKLSFSAQDIARNLEALLGAVKKLKPSSTKGVYIKKITLSSTMGPGLTIDLSSLSA
ncbi:MAG: 50S ribosomal protein L1 [Gammaproteobacteria bacterium]